MATPSYDAPQKAFCKNAQPASVRCRQGFVISQQALLAANTNAFLNCKMIFQLLYWAYQSFFREDTAVTAQTMQIGSRPCRIYGEAHTEYLLLQITGEHELQSMESEVTAIAQSAHHFLFAAIPVESWNDELSPWEAPAV